MSLCLKGFCLGTYGLGIHAKGTQALSFYYLGWIWQINLVSAKSKARVFECRLDMRKGHILQMFTNHRYAISLPYSILALELQHSFELIAFLTPAFEGQLSATKRAHN